MAERAKDYWNRIGRSSNGYNNNAVNVKFRAVELVSVPRERFTSDEVYYCWLQHYSQLSLSELQPILTSVATQLQNKGFQLGTTLSAIGALSAALGVTAVVGSILGITGTLVSLVENSQRKQEVANLMEQLKQIAIEAAQLQKVYQEASDQLMSIRVTKIVTGGAIGFIAHKISK